MDYRAIGLRCGLEVHQQLDTRKLFCACPSRLSERTEGTFLRRLRPTVSELGEVDAAAIEEAKRRLAFVYQVTDNTCLVEADEEPPHEANPDALGTALLVSLMLDAQPVREVHFMRKLVIDGSNTTGFQRSALIAVDGGIEVDGKRIGIPTILLEEDAARKVSEAEGEVVYRLDRLGIPLVEIATTPDIETPEEAAKVALGIGSWLRATRRVLRGIGTIREDLNVSVRGGARIEIKGVQELRMIPVYVEREVERQLALIEAARELKARGITRIDLTIQDVSSVLSSSSSNVVRGALDAGGKVLGARLPGFRGLLKGKLGPELAAHARVAGVQGILHSDELTGYGITDAEVAALSNALGLHEGDAFVLVAAEEAKARHAFEEMLPRMRAALAGIPEETRDPRPDGTSAYSRPLPGKARMYPETDVPPIRVTDAWLERLRKELPEPPERRTARLAERYGVHEQQARQLVQEGIDGTFEAIAREFGDAKLVASVLLYQLAEIRREGLPVDAIPEDRLREMFALVTAGAFAKEAIPQVLREMARSGRSAEEAAKALGLAGAGREEVERVVDEVIASSREIIVSRGEAAVAPLMGKAMERLRGRADGKLVNEILRERLKKESKK
jgi:glutamyl-tRNA(Gln) amidotransferase subunit E